MKFYVRWQMNLQFMPLNPEERYKLLGSLQEMVKADVKAGKIKDWGLAAGGAFGYAIMDEPTAMDVHAITLKWSPYVHFEVNPVVTIDQVAEITQKMSVTAMTR